MKFGPTSAKSFQAWTVQAAPGAQGPPWEAWQQGAQEGQKRGPSRSSGCELSGGYLVRPRAVLSMELESGGGSAARPVTLCPLHHRPTPCSRLRHRCCRQNPAFCDTSNRALARMECDGERKSEDRLRSCVPVLCAREPVMAPQSLPGPCWRAAHTPHVPGLSFPW